MPDKNYHALRYGNEHGEIKYGHIHDDKVISGVMLRTGADGGRHYMTMDSSGSVPQGRRGGTINRCPGSYQVMCGVEVDDEIPAFYTMAENGDIVLYAPHGRIRLMAKDIDIIASGPNNTRGSINIDANEKVIVTAGQSIEINSKVSTKIFSEKTVDMIGKGILNIYGGLIDCADGATKKKRSRGFSINEVQNTN
jgi:hypothetical protein